MILYRPTGLTELELVFDSKMKAWPPRLKEQPIFYPVTNYEYAKEIAKNWNTKADHKVGFVTKFFIDDEFILKYTPKIVGGKNHEEYWVPAEELKIFNGNIRNNIVVIDAYFGENYTGYIPESFILKNKDAYEQFITLAELVDYNFMDFACEISANSKAIYLNFLFWHTIPYLETKSEKITKDKLIKVITDVWHSAFPEIELPSYQNNNYQEVENAT